MPGFGDFLDQEKVELLNIMLWGWSYPHRLSFFNVI
jgi:hypothetical protein